MATPYEVAQNPDNWDRVAAMFLAMQEARGLTYRQVSEATGIGRSHLHQFQSSGEIREPKYGFMAVLAQFYGLTPNDVASYLGILEDAPDIPEALKDLRLMSTLRKLDKFPPALRDRLMDTIAGQVASYEEMFLK